MFPQRVKYSDRLLQRLHCIPLLTYIGTEANHKGAAAAQVGAFFADHFPWILGGIVLICAAVGGTLLVCRRKAVVKAECEADETEENEEDQEA